MQLRKIDERGETMGGVEFKERNGWERGYDIRLKRLSLEGVGEGERREEPLPASHQVFLFRWPRSVLVSISISRGPRIRDGLNFVLWRTFRTINRLGVKNPKVKCKCK